MQAGKKKPTEASVGFFVVPEGTKVVKPTLLQLDFFVFHMLACFRIKFHDQHFFRRGFFVFVGRVKVTGARC